MQVVGWVINGMEAGYIVGVDCEVSGLKSFDEGS